MSNADLRGKFVWHELATTDTAAAAAFYPKVTTWKTQAWEKDASYTMLMGSKGPAGGVMALGAEGGANPYWITYVGSPDIAATVEAAKKLGATVVKDVTDVPTGGKFAILKDPQGATFAVYMPAPGTPSDSSAPEVGEFSWHELATTDSEAAMRFYQQLFGWDKGRVHDMGGGMSYQLFNHGGREVGGIFKGDAGMPTAWTCYVRVDDASKAANAAKSAGGRVLNGPMPSRPRNLRRSRRTACRTCRSPPPPRNPPRSQRRLPRPRSRRPNRQQNRPQNRR
jgi:predicted enzyme related to lactoylglutathione lyase